MAQLIVPNAAQMRLIWSLSGALYALNVLGVVNAGSVAITQALANTLGTAIKAAFASTSHNQAINDAVSLVNVGIRDIRSAGLPEFLDTGGAVAGVATGDVLPPQVAMVVTLRTAFVGQSFRGRVYTCGYDEAVNSPVGISTAVVTAANFVAALKTALVNNSLDLGVISRPRTDPANPSPGFITPVTSVVVRDAVWDTQRRRAIPGI